MHGSRQNQYGPIVPEYFCIDNFNCANPVLTRLSGVAAADADTQCFDLGGRKLNKQGKGLSIQRMADGTVRKVVVK